MNSNRKSKRTRSKKAGQAPGTLHYTGTNTDTAIEISIIGYNSNEAESYTSNELSHIISKIKDDRINWINIDALYNIDFIKEIGEYFKIDNLVLEDVLNTDHLPKLNIETTSNHLSYNGSKDNIKDISEKEIEEEEYVFVTMKMLSIDKDKDEIINEHVSFILGSNFLLSLQEKKGDPFDHIRDRILMAKGRVRKKSSDYLLYLLIDAIVDNYYIVVDNINDKIDDIEENISTVSSIEFFEKIVKLKKELIYLRKSIVPLESELRELIDEDLNMIDIKHTRYFNDVVDHLKSIIQDIEVMRELLVGHIELYMSAQGNKMNNIMKTLTIVASIFIPLTFVAGVYGMNFKYMPELNWYWGYPFALIIMGIIGFGMLFYMKKKRWF